MDLSLRITIYSLGNAFGLQKLHILEDLVAKIMISLFFLGLLEHISGGLQPMLESHHSLQ